MITTDLVTNLAFWILIAIPLTVGYIRRNHRATTFQLGLPDGERPRFVGKLSKTALSRLEAEASQEQAGDIGNERETLRPALIGFDQSKIQIFGRRKEGSRHEIEVIGTVGYSRLANCFIESTNPGGRAALLFGPPGNFLNFAIGDNFFVTKLFRFSPDTIFGDLVEEKDFQELLDLISPKSI